MAKNYKTMMQDELKSDIKTILTSEKPDIHLLKMCLDLDLETTREVIAADKQTKAKVEKLFTEPSGYWIADEICKEKMLNGVIDADKKFQEMLTNLEQLPGKEIVKIFRTASADTENAQKTESLKSVLKCYQEQTAKLHDYEGGDLFYTEFGNKQNCKYWDGYRKDLLDVVGIYQDNPAVEKLAEEKIARIFSYFMYPEKNKDGKYEQKGICYVSDKGAEEYAKRMAKSLLQDVNSITSKFYAEHAQEVFSRAGNYEMAAGVILPVMSKLMTENPQMLGSLLDALGKCRIDRLGGKNQQQLTGMIENEIQQNPISEVSQMFVERAAGIFQHRYASFVKRVVEKYKEQYPEFCDKLCHSLVEAFEKQDKKSSPDIYTDDLAEVYMVYPNKELAETITRATDKNPKCYEGNFVKYAERAEKTGLKCYEDLLDRSSVSERYTFVVRYLDTTCKHDILFEHLKKKKIPGLKIEMCGDYKLDSSKLLPITSLTYIGTDESIKLENPEKLLELPNLETLNIHLKEAQSNQLHKILMQEKPQNLHVLGTEIDFTVKQAENLMKKHPDLLVEAHSDLDIYERNESIVQALSSKEPLLEAIKSSVLEEYLSVIPAKKRPTMADFMKKTSFSSGKYSTYFEFLRSKCFNDEAYRKKMVAVADLLGDQKLKAEVDMWFAVERGSVNVYLKKLPPEKRPTVEQMSENIASYGKKVNMWDIIAEKYSSDDDKGAGIVKDILQTLGFSEKDADKLPQNKNMAAAIEQWQVQQKMNQSRAVTRAAFEKWKASQGIKK